MKSILLIISILSINLYGQNFTQNIRGRVIDAQSSSPLAQVMIEVEDSLTGKYSSLSDQNGYYLIESVPTGRISIKISFTGYQTQQLNNIIHQSGKETILDIELFENVTEMKGVTVKGNSKGILNNSTISISAKSFDVEDTRRYAGSRNDPARMASNFAGVVGNNDSRNDIIIRGNSPQGLLWRMDGIDIPNPNHFGAMGASGGPVTILNNNVLAKSDFITSAFPSMYGNAISGVFDLQMRNGNRNKHEYTGQIGFNGFEAGAEGPLSIKNKSSYLINYRYSTLAVLQKIGLNFGTGTAIPFYQDISFKIHIPLKKNELNIFGIGGISNIHFESDGKTDSTNFYSGGNQDLKYRTSMGVIGATYTYFLNANMNIKTSVGYTYTGVKTKADSVGGNQRVGVYRDQSNTGRLIINSAFNYKINSSKQFNAGINLQNLYFDFNDSVRIDNNFKSLRNNSGNTYLLQGFSSFRYRLSTTTTLNLGLHYQMLTLNQSQALEPRVGIVKILSRKKKISFGSGMHSQIQNMQMYFLQTHNGNEISYTNKELDFSKSIHNVIGYEYKIQKTLNFKSEIYYQYVYNIPVTINSSYYSAINEGTDFNTPGTDSLINKGTGTNYGLEFTLEKTFSKGWYMLNALSLYESKYKGSNKIEKNTAFNGKFIYNLLCGKEIKINTKHTIAFDTKVSVAGGRRYTPIDLASSQLFNKQVVFEDRTNDEQFNTYFRLDFKATYRRSGRKITQEWFIDIQNITNQKNVFLQGYDVLKKDITTQYQLGLFPNFNYRINF
ncbi:MAG: TonB-dependent receptor [Bacteroidia bacterium]|nr:TonB-dependent receptor [Bacteroidia bacterium]